MTKYLQYQFCAQYMDGNLSVLPVFENHRPDETQPLRDVTTHVSRPYSGVVSRIRHRSGDLLISDPFIFFGTFDRFLNTNFPRSLEPEVRRLLQDMLHELVNKVEGMAPIDTSSSHATHCCEIHGCKYGANAFCPVHAKKEQQKYLCERCGEAEELLDEILALQKEYDQVMDLKKRITASE